VGERFGLFPFADGEAMPFYVRGMVMQRSRLAGNADRSVMFPRQNPIMKIQWIIK
jgi:hypothetical protein